MAKRAYPIVLAALAAALAPLGAAAGPRGGAIVAGRATISQPSPASTTINQQSDKAIIDWQSFGIGANESVRFRQPSSSSVILNRVVGGGSSTIAGQLSANGMVFLVNPNGIVFTPSAHVDVNGLIATTSDIANDDFMAGRFNFTTPGNPQAAVVNQGTITAAQAGLVGLVAPTVRNDGVIDAHLGRINLAAGSAFVLDLYGDQLIQFAVPKELGAQVERVNPSVINTGTIAADGGTVWIGADTAKAAVDAAINTSGMIEAQSAHERNGEIVLDAGPNGGVNVAGIVRASGNGAGQTGGTVKVLGAKVALDAGALVDVSGAAGGGTALIGGNFHGAGSERKATKTTIAAGARVTADAVTTGNGGQVAVWSDDMTDFFGSISARGGVQGGNGGAVEVSSQGRLAYAGATDLRAPYGHWGSLLLDPENVTIAANGSAPGLPAAGDTTFDPGADNSVLAAGTLENALALGDVTVRTGSAGTQAGDITVAANLSWNTANTLTLSAFRDVDIDALVTSRSGGAIVLRADNTGTGAGTVAFNGGSISAAGTVSIYYNPSSNPGNGTVNANSYTTPADYAPDVTGGGKLAAYMLVNSVQDLQDLGNNVKGFYALGRSIDAASLSSFVPIGSTRTPFIGTLDGLGNTVSGLTIASTAANVGVFEDLGGGAMIENLAVTGASVTATARGADVGMLAGQMQSSATVSDVSVAGTVTASGGGSGEAGGLVGLNNRGTIADAQAAVAVTGSGVSLTGYGGDQVGGLVATNNGAISDSAATGAVAGGANEGGLVGVNNSTGTIARSDAAGSVTGSSNGGEGGLVGNNRGTVTDSYATGAIAGTIVGADIGGLAGANSGTIKTSYATGKPTGVTRDRHVGGAVGSESSRAVAQDVYWDTTTSGTTTSAAGAGLTAAQLGSGTLPAGFSASVWTGAAGAPPQLHGQIVASPIDTTVAFPVVPPPKAGGSTTTTNSGSSSVSLQTETAVQQIESEVTGTVTQTINTPAPLPGLGGQSSNTQIQLPDAPGNSAPPAANTGASPPSGAGSLSSGGPPPGGGSQASSTPGSAAAVDLSAVVNPGAGAGSAANSEVAATIQVVGAVIPNLVKGMPPKVQAALTSVFGNSAFRQALHERMAALLQSAGAGGKAVSPASLAKLFFSVADAYVAKIVHDPHELQELHEALAVEAPLLVAKAATGAPGVR